MQPDELVVAILSSVPTHEVWGKKRLQKLAFLIKEAGLECDVDFRLKDYGPFSFSLARGADSLSFFGYIHQDERVMSGLGRFVTVYSLQNALKVSIDDAYCAVLAKLDKFSTTELEIAATVRFFEKMGFTPEEAEKETREMKPTKAIDPVFEKSRVVLQYVEEAGKIRNAGSTST